MCNVPDLVEVVLHCRMAVDSEAHTADMAHLQICEHLNFTLSSICEFKNAKSTNV